jgi:hypothetical protein
LSRSHVPGKFPEYKIGGGHEFCPEYSFQLWAMAMKLHEFHARSLESSLTLADASIHRMERLLTDGGEDGVVRIIENTLTRETRDKLLDSIHTLRSMLSTIAECFSLQPHPLDIRRVLDAETSALWVLFEDCRPSRMKGYGQEFSSEARAELDKNIDRLIAHVRSMRLQLQ